MNQEYLNKLFQYKEGELYWKVSRSNRIKVGQLAGDIDGRGYKRVFIDKRHYKVHRIIWIMHYGDIEEDLIIDHIDNNRLNNLISNLRKVTKDLNNLNRSDITGITYEKERNKWKAQTSVNNKTKMIGRFDTKEEAEAAYKQNVNNRFKEYTAKQE